jgi:hypothetical protein
MELFLILLAPALQIIFSVMRVKGLINIPGGLLAVLAIMAGGFLSMQAGSLAMKNIIDNSPKESIHCGMPYAVFFLGGTFVDGVAAIIIGAICIIAYYHKHRKSTSLS